MRLATMYAKHAEPSRLTIQNRMRPWMNQNVACAGDGIAVGFLIASRRPREIPMAFSNVGSLYVNPKSGDVIKWYNGSLPQNVQFKYDTSPCVELRASDKCTIKATKGDYFYNCAGAPDTCPDPGIRVGSAVMAEGQTTPSRTLPGPYLRGPEGSETLVRIRHGQGPADRSEGGAE